ncbi:MAG: putative transcriptional regulator [Osedax symbiont Rs2]|nr:MAG: putative transcriptional regulator [Osedax symbiont Rs2]
MAQSKTAKQILSAAEALFAEQGFVETTMRQITKEANVNLAAINYHFGSKQGLIQSVAEQFLRPFSDYIDQAMLERSALDMDSSMSMEELLELLMRALLRVDQENTHALLMFTRLLELAYMKSQEELRQFIIGRDGSKLTPHIDLIRTQSAIMEDDEFFWRLHFVMGSVIFTLSNYTILAAIEKSRFQSDPEMERILHRMVPVLSAGMQARGDKIYFSRI